VDKSAAFQMFPILLAYLLKYAPSSLQWAAHGFVETVKNYLARNPALSLVFDNLAEVARGVAPADGVHAPDALKAWLQQVFDGAKASIGNPMLRSLFSTVESFVVENLTDLIWSELFGATSEHPNGLVMAVRPLDPSECGAWHHSLVVAAAAVNNRWTDTLADAPATPAATENTTAA
jgi:hypothetical protein